MMAFGDALAVVFVLKRNFDEDDYATFHPDGSLRQKLVCEVRDLMHRGEAMPVAPETISVREAIVEMTSKRLGAIFLTDKARDLASVQQFSIQLRILPVPVTQLALRLESFFLEAAFAQHSLTRDIRRHNLGIQTYQLKGVPAIFDERRERIRSVPLSGFRRTNPVPYFCPRRERIQALETDDPRNILRLDFCDAERKLRNGLPLQNRSFQKRTNCF